MNSTTIIDDTQFRFPVATADLAKWEEKNGKLTAENYEQFCDDVKPSVAGTVGTQEMIDACAEAIEAGASVRNV